MLFKCRFCGRIVDDGDIQGFICLDCIDKKDYKLSGSAYRAYKKSFFYSRVCKSSKLKKEVK